MAKGPIGPGLSTIAGMPVTPAPYDHVPLIITKCGKRTHVWRSRPCLALAHGRHVWHSPRGQA
eukprot:352057-Chlamydomonas_euryale.AAC.4